MNFTDNDIEQIQNHDLTLEQVREQIETIKRHTTT